MSRLHNKLADAWATVASKVDGLEHVVDVKVVKWILQAIAADLVPMDSFDEQDWWISIIQNLNQPTMTIPVKK